MQAYSLAHVFESEYNFLMKRSFLADSNISVFLLAFNEQENIETCVLSVQKYLDKRFKNYEILVISDGSTDNTNKLVTKLAKKNKQSFSSNKRIKLFARKKKLGYGAGLRAGFAHASCNLIFYTDGDNQFHIKDLDKLLPLLSSFDIVSAYRIDRKDPFMRIFIGNVYNLVIRILFNLKVRDIDASFKLYKREIFKNMRFVTNTGLTDAEVLIKAQKQGFKIGQIGVEHYPRIHGRTQFEVGMRNKFFAFVRPRVIIDILREMKTLWLDLHKI